MNMDSTPQNLTEYVTAMIGGQLFGLPIMRVQDVFMPERLTRVPLAPPEIAGVLNLRGRIVTLIDLRRRFGLAERAAGDAVMAIGVEARGESYGLLIDSVGEVLKLDDAAREPIRSISIARLARVSAGIHRLDGQLLDRRRCRPRSRYRRNGDRGMTQRANQDRWLRRCTRKRGYAMKTCLVVDDSSVIRKVARRILEGLEFEIVEAEDGEQALDACKRQLPEAILLDWNMPKMDGYEFLRVLRKLPGGDGPKVVFCTTENDVAHIARALHAGANEYIMKPFDKEIVEAKFQEVGLI